MSTTAPKLTLYRGFPTTPSHVWSPFANKLETRLRLAHIPYHLAVGNPRSAPRGKIPYLAVDHGDSNSPTLLADTALITSSLIANGILPDLNAPLTPAQKAQDLALRALLEDKFYFFATRERWVDNYATMRDGVLAALPYPVRLFVGNLAYRAVVSTLHGQGAGRYSEEEARGLKREVWEGLEAVLGESKRGMVGRGDGGKPFWVLGREEPTEADATVYGFIAAGLVCEA